MSRYHLYHETYLLTFFTSRRADVIVTSKLTGREVYFQPGEAGSTLLDVLDENQPDDALHAYLDSYFSLT